METIKQETKKAATFPAIGKENEKNPPAVNSDQNDFDGTPDELETETETSGNAPDIYKIYQNNIYSYIDEFIELEYAGLTDNELKENKAFFPLLIDYLYNNYICLLLDNKNNKNSLYNDIELLDNLFSIYTRLVYKYKWNNKPYIVEFALFTGINKDTFYNWLNGIDNNNNIYADGVTVSKYLTRERSDVVAKWISVCERALLDNNDTIKDIFILKAKHGYRDNNNDVTITVNHKAIVSADVLPDLIGINSKN